MALRNRELHAKNDDDECLLAVWLAGNTLFLINVLTLCCASSHPDQLSLTIPLRVGTVSTSLG